jgi:hypothetical protein
MLSYLRKIGPFALWTAGLVSLAISFVGIVSWLSGSFVPFTSAEDFWRRLATGIVIVLATGLLCGIAADLGDRFDDWRTSKRK